MAILLKLLPFFLLGFLLWRMVTAQERTTRALMRNSTPLSDWEILQPVQAFAKVLEVKGFEVRILEMEQVNGVALPGGEIFISRGLYDKFLGHEVSRDEVAAVIAHEVGHVALGHHKRRLRAWRTETAALAVLWFLMSRLMMGWIGLLAVLGLNLYRSQLSQRDEFEADVFSAQLMSKAGLDASAIIQLLEKLDGWSGGAGPTGPIRWMMSHPSTDERIAHVRAAIEAGERPETSEGLESTT